MGEELVGRRADDGNLISFREAVKMFATKEELAGMRSGVDAVVVQLGTMVTRGEHTVRWERDDEFRSETKATLEVLKAQRLPQWVVTWAGVLTAIGIAVWSHSK